MTPQTPPDPTQQSLLPQLPQLELPPKPKSTPLDPPLVYYNQKWRVAPLVIDTQEQADALDPSEWFTIPAAGPASKSQYPKLFANNTVKPKIVSSAEEAAALGDGWSEFTLPDSLCKAAEANNAAKAQADAAKAQAQSQSQSQAQPPAQAQAQAPYYPGQPYYQNPYPPPGY